jgi:hypothetical protein
MTTANEVIQKVYDDTKSTIDSLNKLSYALHCEGYHERSAHVGNLATKIERATSRAIDELMKETEAA